MEHLPSEGNIEYKQHELKIVASDYEDVISGKRALSCGRMTEAINRATALKCWNLRTVSIQGARLMQILFICWKIIQGLQRATVFWVSE